MSTSAQEQILTRMQAITRAQETASRTLILTHRQISRDQVKSLRILTGIKHLPTPTAYLLAQALELSTIANLEGRYFGMIQVSFFSVEIIELPWTLAAQGWTWQFRDDPGSIIGHRDQFMIVTNIDDARPTIPIRVIIEPCTKEWEVARGQVQNVNELLAEHFKPETFHVSSGIGYNEGKAEDVVDILRRAVISVTNISRQNPDIIYVYITMRGVHKTMMNSGHEMKGRILITGYAWNGMPTLTSLQTDSSLRLLTPHLQSALNEINAEEPIVSAPQTPEQIHKWTLAVAQVLSSIIDSL